MRRKTKALEEWVNLSDSMEDLAAFQKRWPRFFKRADWQTGFGELQTELRDPAQISWPTEFRERLRIIWRSKSWNSVLGTSLLVLLGIDPHWARKNFPITASLLTPEWKTATFTFKPSCQFHAELWHLFQHSSLARVCVECGRYFVGGTNQIRCSSACQLEHKRRHSRDWWREHGNDWKKGRSN